MHPLTTLRSWLGRPVSPSPRRPAARLGCEGLEDRSTPAGLTLSNSVSKDFPALPQVSDLPVSPSEVLARTTSANPLGDLANVVAALGLGADVDPARSAVVLSDNGVVLLSVALKPGAAVPAVVQTLAASGLYASVSPNYVLPTSRTGAGADLRERVPNDPRFGEQFFHPIVRTPQAWDKGTGSPSVVTAVLDDGLDLAHPDLAGNVWVNAAEIAGNGIDDDANGFVDDVNGFDFVNDGPGVAPDDPAVDVHGTQVAGLIAGRIDNAAGGAGVAGTSRVLPLKVVGNGPTTSLTLARAVSYAVKAGAKIINCSLNVDPFVDDPAFRAALAFAYNSGVLWVNSEGNGNVQGPPREAFEEMILVGATDRNDVKAAYSNYGPGLDLVAPGGDGTGGLLTAVPGGGYAPATGTSMAAALASGTAALIWSANPGYTRDQVASALLAHADDIRAKNPGLEDRLGAGRLDAEGAVNGPGVTRLGTLTGLPADGAQVSTLSGGPVSVRLTAPLDAATIRPSNFELRGAGADERFGTSDDFAVPLLLTNAGTYRIGTNHLDLTVGQSLVNGLYRFTARSGGLTDPFGRPVDGDGDGTPGGDLVRTFRIGFQVSGRVFEDTQNSGFPSATDPGVGGQTVYADLNGNGLFDQSTYSTSLGQAGGVPDADLAGKIVPVSVTGLARPASKLEVSVLVRHPRPADLKFILASPDGGRIELLANRPLPVTPGQPLQLFVFSDEADNSSVQTPTLTTHKLRPDRPLAGFNGVLANGGWALTVVDTSLGDTGEVQSAALTLADEPAAVTAADGSYVLTGLPAGTVRVNVAGGPDFARSAGGAAAVVEVGGDAAATADLGLVRPAGIYGRVLVDDNSRDFSPADEGLAGVSVYLDLDGDGVRGTSDPSTVTDANGTFSFGPLLPGSYAVRVVIPPGFVGVAGVPVQRVAVLPGSGSVSTGNDFLLARAGGRATVTVGGVVPLVRTTGVDAVGVSLSEPLPPLTLAQFALTRNGEPLSLAGATVFGGPLGYTLSGLRTLTSADGVYQVFVFPPAPAGQPGRQPLPGSVEFTVDGTAPAAVLTPESRPTDAVRLAFNEPVTGVAVAALRLTRDGVTVPLDGVRVEPVSATEFRVSGLSAVTAARGLYTLSVRANTSGVADAAGNPLAATASTSFRVGPEPVPATGRRTVIGAGAGGPATVAVFDVVTGRLVRSFMPFEPGFTGGVRVAAADLNADGVDDVIAAAGPGGGPRLMAFDGVTGDRLLDLMAFEPTFSGGVNVTAGELGGRTVLVVAPDQGGGPRVRVFDAAGNPLADFFGIADPAFRGGARPALGDVTADGTGDLIVAAGFGGGPRVAVYDGTAVLAGSPVRAVPDFFAFEPGLRNGAFVAAGDVDGDGFAELILGGGPGGAPRVRVLGGQPLVTAADQVPVADFFAADPADRGGVRVAAKDTDGDGLADLIAGDGNGTGGSARVFFARDVLRNPEGPPVGQLLTAFGGFGDGIYVG